MDHRNGHYENGPAVLISNLTSKYSVTFFHARLPVKCNSRSCLWRYYEITDSTGWNKWAGLASQYGVKLVSGRASAWFHFGSSFSSKPEKVVVCGHCLVTLSLTISETLKWLSSLPILMQESFLWWQYCNRCMISLSLPCPPPPFTLP